MEYFLFIFYLVLFAWFVTRVRFFNRAGLTKPQLISIFLMKVIAGIFYGWMGRYYGSTAQMLDTWSYHARSIEEYDILLIRPYEYFTNIFHNPYPGGMANFFGSTASYWNDLKANVFVKFLSILDIFSFGNYYINVIFYSFLTLYGGTALYRVMRDTFPDKKNILILTVFFCPSFFYWSSGIHKEGLIFTAVALIIYHLYYGAEEGRYGIKRLAGIGLGLLILLLLRNFILIVVIPAMISWWLAYKFPSRKLWMYAGVYSFFTLLFFTLRYVYPPLDFPAAVVEKQQAFLALRGANSTVQIAELQPHFGSFLENMPQAISLAMIRPFPSDIHHLPSLAAALENGLILLLFLVAILVPAHRKRTLSNLSYFCIFFSALLILAIGFSVNNLGAISRYRSIIFPLLISLACVRIGWTRIETAYRLLLKKTIL